MGPVNILALSIRGEATVPEQPVHPAAPHAAATEAGAPAWHRRLPLRTLHRTSAKLLALFIALHLVGHLAGLAGVAAHQSVLDALRLVYRRPVVEALLLGCVVFQAGSGLGLLWRGRARCQGAIDWLQRLSGAYLGLFLAIHVGAVLQGRAQGLDTNLHFAAAGMQVPPWPWFFGPYYFLAVSALGAHVGCALYWNLPPAVRARVLALSVLAGLLLAACLVTLLAGGFHALEVPSRYLGPFAAATGKA